MVVSDKLVQSFVKNEHDSNTVPSSVTKMIIYDLEAYIKDRTNPYGSCI